MKWFNEETVLRLLKDIEKKPIDLECVKEVNGRLVPCLRSGIQIIPPKIEDYPSIELPDKYGRLMDADAFFRRVQKQTIKLFGENSPAYSYFLDILDMIKSAPTVIESSKER